MKEFDFRVLNADYGLYSCTLNEIPDSYKEQHEKQGRKLEQTIIYYFKERDYLVMNEEYPLYGPYKELVLTYMGLCEERRHNALKCTDNDEIYRFLLFVESVIKYRLERKVGASA